MKTYVILSYASIVGLAEIVNQGLAGNWEVAGGMVVEKYSTHETWYHQAMIRPPEVKAPCPSCGARELHTRDCPHDGNG